MRRLRLRVVQSRLSAALRCAAPVCLALALAGCAASSAADRYATASTGDKPARVAMEGDGLPAQVAPTASARRQPDDPSEPYSPLYGSRPPYRLADLDGPWSAAKEDAIIALAITAHEMRRP